MSDQPRSRCAINLALELFGDQWSLLIVRDLMFNGKRHFRELLASEEHIASNVLAERLKRLVDAGVLSRSADPRHRQKAIYRLTDAGIELAPILLTIQTWGSQHLPVRDEPGLRTRALAEGGPPWEAFMAELREEHLDPLVIGPVSARRGPTATRWQAARETVAASHGQGDLDGAIADDHPPWHAIVQPPDQPASGWDRTGDNGGERA